MNGTLIGEGDNKNKGKIIGKGVGQFHDDIKRNRRWKIFQQAVDAPKFRCDVILGISKKRRN